MPMRRYRIPMDLRQEEKIIGGYMSLRQIGYLLAGFMVGAFLAYALNWLPIIFLPVAVGGFLGFGNVRGESGDRWVLLIMNRRQREFYFKRFSERSAGRRHTLNLSEKNDIQEKTKTTKR